MKADIQPMYMFIAKVSLHSLVFMASAPLLSPPSFLQLERITTFQCFSLQRYSLVGGHGQSCVQRMRSLPDTSTDGEQWELNP